MDLRPEPERREVLSHYLARRPGPVDEHGLCRPPGERLDAERPRTREEIQHPQARQVAEDREQRLADALGGGAARARGLEAAAPQFAGDDPHTDEYRSLTAGRPASRNPGQGVAVKDPLS